MIEGNNVRRILVFAAGLEMICFREAFNWQSSIYGFEAFRTNSFNWCQNADLIQIWGYSVCSLNKKCHPLSELLIALAHVRKRVRFGSFVWGSPAFFSFKYWWKTFSADFVSLLVLFASLSSRRRFKSSFDKVANLGFDSAMTKLIELLYGWN